MQTLLEEHANDDPKLSYTGKPIVTWPKRVRCIFLLFTPCSRNRNGCMNTIQVTVIVILHSDTIYKTSIETVLFIAVFLWKIPFGYLFDIVSDKILL